MDKHTLYQALACLNLITIPAAVYYFYRCKILEGGLDNAFKYIRMAHARTQRMAEVTAVMRDYIRGLVARLNRMGQA